MSSAEPTAILADITAMCPEVPAPIIMRSLVRAARRFASTCMYECWIDIPTQEDVQHYPFEYYMPEGWGVQYINKVEYNGCCIPCVDDECGSCQSGWVLEDLTTLRLVGYCPGERAEDCYDRLRVKVALRLDNNACHLPTDLIQRFEEELKNGALGYILSMKGQEWTDFRAAEFYENQFEGNLADAKGMVQNKFSSNQCTMGAECLI